MYVKAFTYFIFFFLNQLFFKRCMEFLIINQPFIVINKMISVNLTALP